jgi:hypothetical protein
VDVWDILMVSVNVNPFIAPSGTGIIWPAIPRKPPGTIDGVVKEKLSAG